jgi:hypothetical protein
MKTTYWPPLALAALMGVGFCPMANANLFSDNFETLVVAETAKDAPQPQGAPITYSAIDGGYIEAGNPEVGDTPPTADQVRQSLYDALKAQGFEANRTSPSVLLIYYWGVLRPDREEIRLTYGVRSNLNARLKLVSTEQLGAEVENHILGHQKADGTDMNASSPPLLVGPTESVVQNARYARIFVIVSAFDYAGLAQRDVKPLWRVKMSAQETSGDMNEVIPSLVAVGAPYFGKNIEDPKLVKATLTTAPRPAATPSSLLQPAPETKLDGQLIESILNHERTEFSGANPGRSN